MAELLELKPATAPATVLESEDMGRERRARGFDIGASRRGLLWKKEGARVAMDGGLRARGEVCSGNNRDRRSLGGVEEGV